MTAAEFQAAFPAFEDFETPVIEAAIAAAAPYFDVVRWGGFYTDGLGNWVAHRLATRYAQAIIGPSGSTSASNATSKSVGSVSISRSDAAIEKTMSNPYLSTVYGQEYIRLMRLVGIGALAVDQPTSITFE